jgi:hypothetical protein
LKRLNLGCGKHPLAESEGWVNADRVPLPGVNHVMDLFRYPWGFPDDTFDEFLASHIIEHIPHEPKMTELEIDQDGRPLENGRNHAILKRWQELKDLDGFFCFFSEIWRIGKNGAKVNIVCPYGYTMGAFQDPTHTRNIVPVTFAYLTAETRDSKDFDYQVPCLFKTNSVTMDIDPSYVDKPEEFRAAVTHLWGITRNMYVELEIVK